jgi:hypothetical protein
MSTIKVDTIATRTGSGNITASNTIAGTSATLSGTLGVTGDLTVDTNTLVVDASNNRMGVGTATPAQPLHVKGGAVQFENTQNTYLQVNTTDTHFYTAGAHPLRFGTNSTERLRILPTGGLTFNGDTATANALDDYEEGSFSLTEVQGSITGDTVRSGSYTKIGRMVMIDFDITGTAITISSYVGFSGLPFTPASTGTGFTSTEDIDLANGVEMAVGTNGRLYLSGGGGSAVSRMSGSLVYSTA